MTIACQALSISPALEMPTPLHQSGAAREIPDSCRGSRSCCMQYLTATCQYCITVLDTNTFTIPMAMRAQPDQLLPRP